ncbi:hypothetical protein ONE63_006597 [Megalurothrips usitatus]|uniref:Protein FAM161A n=1 Tax=Megalurothrips usitatus TaxID=439358 RepID=A0AAV7XTY6_9NEOP|nr:hypothetical protein ONE63_006597 [Megalurothrips usitatus]
MSLSTSCLRVPVNPYNQQPSPSYERSQAITPNVEEDSSLQRKLHSTNVSSRPSSSMNTSVPKSGGMSKRRGKKTKPQDATSSPLDSFLDFYESIPDYQDVTHLSDKEFSEKMRILRDRQRQYLHNLGGTYTPVDYEESHRDEQSYQKKSCKSVNKLELAKEWVNKSCDSLSSIGRKSDEYRLRSIEVDNQLKKASTESPRKYELYRKKNETEGMLLETGSSLSADSNIMKTKVQRSGYAIEEEPRLNTASNTIQDCGTPFTSTGRSESCQGLSNFYNLKDSHIHSYEYYNVKERNSESSPPPHKNKSQSYGLQSSEASELNAQECTSPIGLVHHDVLTYEDYYVPTSGWMQSDSDSMLGTMHHIPSTRPSTGMVSQSLPGSPVTKRRSNSSKVGSPKKKTRRKRRLPSKSVTKPVPFSFMCNERQYSRSTPDLSSHCRSPSPKNFRARPIPRNLFSNYVYQKRQEDEFFRALKRKVRAEELVRTASLPPSMEFRERLSRVQAEAAAAEAASLATASSSTGGGGGGGSGTARPPRGGSGSSRGRRGHGRPRRPPDFSKCHEKMRQELQERQGRNVTTSPSPYSLRTSSLSPRRKCLQGSSSSGSDSRRCRPRSRSGLDVSTCRSNLAALLRIQSARQRLEDEHHRLREEQARRTELRLKERLRRLTPAWRSIQYSTEEDLALRAAARREEERERRREHGVLMRHMRHRVHTIPTLFERQSATVRPATRVE